MSHIILSLPQLAGSFISVFFDTNLARLYLQEGHLISPSLYGIVSSILGSLGLFVDVFLSYQIDQKLLSRMNNEGAGFRKFAFLLLNFAALHAAAYFFLFSPHLLSIIGIDSANISIAIWYMAFMLLRNMIPLSAMYNTFLQRFTISGVDSTKDADQYRSKVLATKHQMDIVGGLIGGFVGPVLKYVANIEISFGQATSMGHAVPLWNFAAMNAAILLLSYLALMAFIYARKDASASGEMQAQQRAKQSFLASLRHCFRNTAFRSMLYLFLFESMRSYLWAGLFSFYMSFVLKLRGADFDLWSNIIQIFATAASAVTVPVWNRVTQRMGVFRSWIFSYILQIANGFFVYCLVQPGSPSAIYVYVALSILGSVVGRAPGYLFDLIKARVYDYDQMLDEGLGRTEAMAESVWGLLPRFVSLGNSAVAMSILTHFGNYKQDESDWSNDSLTRQVIQQTALAPTVTALGCLLLMLRFPINTDEKHRKILGNIKQRKEDLHSDIVDPVTGQLLRFSASSKIEGDGDEGEGSVAQARSNFFDFELRSQPFRWKHAVAIEIALVVFWVSLFGLFASFFLQRILAGADGMATSLLLWLASLSFTLSVSHYLRVSPAKTMQEHAKSTKAKKND